VVAALFHKAPGAAGFLACALLTAAPVRADVASALDEVNIGGALALTSDYIYRGVSESDGHAAVQGDLHLHGNDGTFLGVWASSRDPDLEPGADAVIEVYLGHRFDLGASWSSTLTARSHYYVGSSRYEPSADYQELSAALTYLDRWSLSLTAVPNAVRYWVYRRLSRSPAWIADASGQWSIGEQFFATGGAGYYYSSGTGAGMERATGYAYGNVGLAWEVRRLRFDVGYFLAQEAAQRSFPYPIANRHFAATVAWHF